MANSNINIEVNEGYEVTREMHGDREIIEIHRKYPDQVQESISSQFLLFTLALVLVFFLAFVLMYSEKGASDSPKLLEPPAKEEAFYDKALQLQIPASPLALGPKTQSSDRERC